PAALSWFDFSFNGPGTAIQPTFNPQTQAFRWDTTGSKPGTYTATVVVTDFAYYDTGTLMIHLVPEPAGAVLFGLVMFGIVGFPRRRRS
ncbi:MAG TPA: PEP-CTERM sorting domain-containing protein, partial [Lacipirellulaceae bacterium]|nr:PEP-CTERM sorting domain-containing protein [Lacipirellulaceae bacterium]